MSDNGWVYDQSAHAFRKVLDGAIKQTLGDISGPAHEYINKASVTYAKEMFGLLTSGTSRDVWVKEFRRRLKDMYAALYLSGKGGRANMTQSDWGRVGSMLVEQYKYLNRFADQIFGGDTGSLSDRETQLTIRMTMYFRSAMESYGKALVKSYGMPALPQYPGDGKTECLTACRCHLEIEETKTAWQVRWVMSEAEHCPDCERLAGEWNPLIIKKGD